MPNRDPAPLPLIARSLAGALAALVLVAACAPFPQTGRDPARLGPAPPLVPLDALLTAPPPEATAETAAALAARGAALKAGAAALE